MRLVLALLLFATPAAADALDRAADLLARVRPEVEKECGARFAEPPEVAILSREEAIEAFSEDLRPRMVLLYPGATAGQVRTLLRIAAGSSVASCVARYSPHRKAIVLVREGFRASLPGLGLRTGDAEALLLHTLAHECVHALDDRRFDLEAYFAGAADREDLRARAMLAEGRAEFFGGRVSAGLDLPDHVLSVRPGGTDPENAKGIYFRLLYERGRAFVAALVERGGVPLADRAVQEPPRLTHFICHPERWPGGEADPRPEKILAKAFPDAKCEPLSELQLLARYIGLLGEEPAGRLFAGFRGGVQALVLETNAAVLAFADEESAKRYEAHSKTEVPATRAGTLVVRAAGPAAEEVAAALSAALR